MDHPADPNVFETANAGFAQALYEDYLRDPNSVAPDWRTLFESGRVGERPAAGNGTATTAAGKNGGGAATQPPAAPAAAPAGPGSHGNTAPIKGPAARLVQNMTESLSVPTATTFREIPVAALESARSRFNAGLKAAGRPEKASFTHFIAWALVQAARQHPVMGQSFALIDGVPHRVTPDGIHLGLAVDVERKDGSRGLVVPVLKHAEAMSYAEFQAAYDTIVEKARTNKLMPDDFAGGSMTLTNPGGLGTVASVPRLMASQGSIIAVGAIAYPPEFATATPDTIARLGLSKVMTMTSTYDHRVIQGAESGAFLRTVEQMLAGSEGFYEGIFGAFGLTWADGAPAARIAGAPSSAPSGSQSAHPPAVGPSTTVDDLVHVAAAMALVKAFRTHGHLAARLDPLGSEPSGDPALDPGALGLTPDVLAKIPARVLRIAVPGETLADALPSLQATYCGTIAYEVEHVSDHGQRVWLRQMIESGAHRRPMTRDDRLALLDRLIAVEAFERFLHKAYLGHKRFSIEGVDLLVPMLDLVIELSADRGAREVVVGMAHRGRLNVLTHNVGRPYVTIFAEFEGAKHLEEVGSTEDPGTGDVKYHHGADGAYRTRSGKAITVALAHNPSHLEFVGPVVDGRARAQQTQRRGQEAVHDPVVAVPVVIHGDAAFAGQGVVAETLNLGALRGYRVGGTVHLITNNQIGFTTDMSDARSTRHASDLAKGFDIPIIHVNADDAEACLAAVRLASMYREEFHRDALIDLVGYRRWGHNEGDEPSYTQPLMYERIKNHPTARELYAATLVAENALSAEDAESRYAAAYQRLVEIQQGFKASAPQTPATGTAGLGVKVPSGEVVETAVPAEQLLALNTQLLTVPEGFTVHPKLKRQLERRIPAMGPDGGIDWGHAEALAFASLLTAGVPIRLTGQDTERGTFSHRHLVLHDAVTGQTVTPISRLPGALAAFEVYNSPLSELAALGFEYGYATAAPEALVLWEAQFGDFINGGQVIVDQFMAAGLSKWGVTNRLTLLLPHGYEGQGPEHSSARIERFLQQAAEGNFRVANCTTPAQFFHLLRRQARRNRIRPLVVFTPKSLLRLPQAASHLEELTTGTFRPVIDDPEAGVQSRAATLGRVVLCSGKIYYDLLAEAAKLGDRRPAIVRLEGLYTFPEDSLKAVLGRYPAAHEVIWAQEEPRNMGAWSYVAPKLGALLQTGQVLRYAGRPERASPAEGYPTAHAVEQARIVAEALG
ncbi:MAG TPA: multifunctional oxoglutarate decarboxylase/oxoglutarate dehydrogenase thiamine pyrophosphate-binding subunit/dihydrolipoyllysine-residue succinyltransferase subunit [Gemmatimonadales bacterium]|nr:multifunctional oxoglutarate decarboxylase/oxoglutarate dehydrogenase thiamine pyrophosphate-binding subunit/dihydrolipoyllysine-residue succinyltransferase subunit [Gemmatimonadales bacterium]